MSYSDNAYSSLSSPGRTANPAALPAADKVSSKGVCINLYAAIERSIQILGKHNDPVPESIIVLMSDGKMDVTDINRSAELKARIH